MNPSAQKWFRLYLLWFCVYAIAIAAYLWIDAVQPVPPEDRGTAVDPSTFLSAEQYMNMKMFSAIKNWLFFISYPWQWGVYLFLLLSGAAYRWNERHRFPVFVLYFTLTVLVLQLPVRLTGYAVSRHFGVSTQPFGGWIKDLAVGFAVDYLIMLAVLWVAFIIMGRVKRWWLSLWMLTVPFLAFLMYIQPVVIDPLYNQYAPLSDPVLEKHILDLADRAGIPAERVYEVNISEKTNALNAYVTGIGPTLRIVLWDTTLRALTEQEILFIMAHEIGHYVMRHLELAAVGSVASSLVLLYIGSRLYKEIMYRWGGLLRIRRVNDRSSLPLLMLILSVLSFAAAPVSNAVSRQAEHAADRYAMEMIGNGQGAVGMYQKLAASSLGDIDPPLLVKWFRSTHPSIKERILYVQQDWQ